MNNPTSKSDTHVEIYTDGACEPNPGPGGYGVVLLHPKSGKRREESGGFRLTTNNRMEIYAALRGLAILDKPCKVTLYSDSRYVVDTIMQGWAVKWQKKDWWISNSKRAENSDLWKQALLLCEKHEVEFRWVKGHAGIPENERCDQLSCAALRQPNLPIDEGYENKSNTEGERRQIKEGQPCDRCSAPLIKQHSNKKAKGDFYYEYFLYCTKCKAAFTVEEAKRPVQRPASLF